MWGVKAIGGNTMTDLFRRVIIKCSGHLSEPFPTNIDIIFTFQQKNIFELIYVRACISTAHSAQTKLMRQMRQIQKYAGGFF